MKLYALETKLGMLERSVKMGMKVRKFQTEKILLTTGEALALAVGPAGEVAWPGGITFCFSATWFTDMFGQSRLQ